MKLRGAKRAVRSGPSGTGCPHLDRWGGNVCRNISEKGGDVARLTELVGKEKSIFKRSQLEKRWFSVRFTKSPLVWAGTEGLTPFVQATDGFCRELEAPALRSGFKRVKALMTIQSSIGDRERMAVEREIPHFQIKRIYEPYAASDGTRILVDRLWPRGVLKAEARIDRWMKDIAPSPELRKWFGHQPERFAEFARMYEQELTTDATKQALVTELLSLSGTVTLLYAAKDERHNHAVVLLELLRKTAKEGFG